MAGRWTRSARPTTDEQAIAACKRANAHDFVEKLPEGYQTQIQRSGGSLSGGLGAAVGEPAILLHAPLPSAGVTMCGRRGDASKLTVSPTARQKQRIAIARAIIREPSVFLLDEATSALDSQSESVVKEALDRETKGKTVVVIAHRLTTTKHCDNIVLMDHGTVAEEARRQGGVSAHDQLIAGDGQYPMGLYAKLWAHWTSIGM